jgi:outer membrane protein
MNSKIFIRTIIITILLTTRIAGQSNKGNAGTSPGDSLSLKEIIDLAISNHPSVKIAEEAINNANTRINLAKTGYYPEVEANASYSNMGPVMKLTIPDMGTFQLYPENNYSAAINYKQIVYDFGRIRQGIEIENENKAIGEQALEQVKQKLSLLAVNNYYTLLFLQSAIRIKEEQLKTLNEHLDHIKKMRATGSATEYQVLSTEVKISAVESQKYDLEAALAAQQALLNSLIGNDKDSHPVVKKELTTELPVLPSDSLVPYAMKNRDEVLLNQKKTSLAELKYGMLKLQNRPMLSFIATGGAKNGYIPNLNEMRFNYVMGLGLRIPIFDGMKNKYNLMQAQSTITSLSYESDFTKRNITSEIQDAEAYIIAAKKKVAQYDLQLELALKAYSLALTSFNSGVITNLDLLDSNTAVSESRLLLLKSQIDFDASIYKLRAATGERIYQ